MVMVESGYIVIANTVNLEKEIDEEYSKLILYLMEKTTEFGGTLIRICADRMFILPKNVIIEKLVKDMNNPNKKIFNDINKKIEK